MVGADDELPALEIGSPMAHRLDEANELALVGRQFGMLQCDGPTVEHDRATSLV
jgi:hypothetical protein